jgi:hypothetical protein
MKTKITLIFLFILSLSFSQNVVKVKGKHTKTLIHTLKEGEYISRGESKILIQSTGVGHEFIVENGKREYKLYKNGKLQGNFSSFYFSGDKFWKSVVEINGKKLYYMHFTDGGKHGPYDQIDAITSGSNGVYNVDGYQYSLNDMYYFHSFHTKKTYGPYSFLHVSSASKNELAFSYKQNEKVHIHHNGVDFGPYEDAKFDYTYLAASTRKFAIKYKNKNGEWKVYFKKEIPITFRSEPNVRIFSNDNIAITGTELGTDRNVEYVYVNGQKFESKYYKYEVIYNSFGDVLHLFKNNGKDTVFESKNPLGVHHTIDLYWGNIENTPYFRMLFKKDIGNGVFEYSAYKKNEFKVVGTSKDFEIRNFFIVGEDFMYIRSSDSTLVLNGKETEHSKVASLDCSYYPDIYMIKKNGIYDDFYKNGKKITFEEAKMGPIYPEWYNVKGKAFNFEFKDDKAYVIPKGSEKRFGPVEASNFFAFSKGNKHYAECDDRKMELFIDGKLFSPGFSLKYNPQTNQFHWLSLDKNKLYLHTYIND